MSSAATRATAAAAAAAIAAAGEETLSPIPRPRIGGGHDSTAWTGGPNEVAKRLARPSSTMARRPTDFKSANTIEHIATKGLPEDHHIGPDEKTSKITLTSWVNSTRSYMEEHGLDTVFYVYDRQTDSETYLLTDWGSASPAKITAWVATLRAGVPKDDGTISPPCDYDLDNLKWSGKAILNSVSLPLWETVEKDLGVDASGPEAFAAVVYKLQQVSSAAVRTLVDELKALSLLREPGQDVEIFGGRVVELCRRISGTGSAPSDLVVLAAGTFLECDVLPFKLKAIQVHDTVDDNFHAMTWDSVVRTLKTKYQSLKGQGLWTPQITNKKKESELSGLHAAINKLAAKVDGSSGEGGGASTSEGPRCYGCGELGHLSRDCPKNRSSSGSRTPPKDGEPHTKTVDGASHSWCSICRRWTTGSKEHPTDKHVRRDRPSTGSAPAPAPTPVPAPSPSPTPAPVPSIGGMASYNGGVLSLQGGLFLGQLAEVSENVLPQVLPQDLVDPCICSDDFFQLHAGSGASLKEEGSPEINALGSLGIYKVTEGTEEAMTDFLSRVAFCRNVSKPNVESWVTAVEAKLGDIGITTPQMAVAEIHSINPKLVRAGHIGMFTQTLDLIARLGVEEMRDGGESEMLSFLTEVATAKNLTGQNVRVWVMKVYGKLQVLDITTVKATISWIVTLNSELSQAGLSTLHRQTLDLMARKGVAILLRTQSAPEEHPEHSASSRNHQAVSDSTLELASLSPEMGQGLAGKDSGPPVQTLRNTGADASELTYESNDSVGSEESDDPNEFEPDGGHCSECGKPGTIGESCPNCERDGGVYLNFHAGL